MWRAVASLLVSLWLGLPLSVNAHPLAPALLELHASPAGAVEVLWRQYAVQQAGNLEVTPRLPPDCKPESAVTTELEAHGALVKRWRMQCPPGDWTGRRIAVAGLRADGMNVIVRLTDQHGERAQRLLSAGDTDFLVPSPAAPAAVLSRYLKLGAAHLAGGLDHLLFLVGLLMVVRGRGRLFGCVTAFTVGHSLTLALAVLGLVRVDSMLMELGIALSLLILARELLARRPGLLRRKPLLMAGLFGLLHGLGFASALHDIGIPAQQIVLALLGFNLGIELGQLLVIAAAILCTRCWLLWGPEQTGLGRAGPLIPAYILGAAAAYWTLVRATALQLAAPML